LTALHVSSNIIAHYQEHLNCSYSFWFIHMCRCRLLSAADNDTVCKCLWNGTVT